MGEEERIHLTEHGLATHLDPTGASVDILLESKEGCYNGKQLLKLNGVAKYADFKKYPKPVPFHSDSMRGILTGIKS